MNQLIGTKPSRFLLAITTLALTLLFTFAVTTAVAGVKTHKQNVPPPDDPRTLVESVYPAKGIVVIELMRTKSSQTYAVDGLTMIKVNGMPGKIGQIKAGMQVRDYVERDATALDSISVSPADPAPTHFEY